MKNYYIIRFRMSVLFLLGSILILNNAVHAQLYSESFDADWTGVTAQSPAPTARNWSSDVLQNNAKAWHRNTYYTNWPYGGAGSPSGVGALGTSNYARFNTYGINPGGFSTLYSPVINYAAYNGQVVYLSFYYINPDGTDFVNLYFSGNGGISRNLMASVTNATVWTKFTIKIPPKYLTSQFTVDLEGVSDFGFTDIGIDEFVIDTPLVITTASALPLCNVATPINLSASSMGAGTTYVWSTAATSQSINVAPSVTTTYTCTATRNGYSKTNSFTVSVNPLPTFSQTPFPTGSTTCTQDYVKLTADQPVTTTPFIENFSVSPSWTVFGILTSITGNYNSSTNAGGTAPEARMYYAGGANVYSEWYMYPNDGNVNNYKPIDLKGFTTASLSFKQMFDAYTATAYDRDIFVDISTDQIIWNPIYSNRKITADIATSTVSGIDLTKYVGTTVYIRFRYSGDSFGLDYWYIDNITISGTLPVVSWPVGANLFTDTALTIPYASGGNQTTVYAVPDGTSDYAVKFVAGSCNKNSPNIPVTHLKKIFTGTSSNNWNNATNWLPSNWPNSLSALPVYNDRCVIIPNGKTANVNVSTAIAKMVTVQAGGKLNILANAALTTNDSFINQATVDDVVIASDGNLKQITDNPVPANSGQVTAKRNIKLNAARTEYNYLISPVVGQSLKTIYPGVPTTPTYPYVLYHNEATNYFYNSSGAYISGRGLAVKEPNSTHVPAANLDAVFKGALANGVINFPLAFTDNTVHGYNLVGNPYASSIDLQSLYTQNIGNIYSTFYFWDNAANDAAGQQQQGSGYSGRAYAVYNAVSNMGNAAGYLITGSPAIGTKIPNKIAKVGQGFMVRTPATGKTLTFNNSIRVTDNTGASFFSKTSDSLTDRYWLKLLAPGNMVNTIGVIYFEGGAGAFGQDDSEVIGNSSDQLYSIAQDHHLQIEGRSNFVDTDKIILGTSAFADGIYTLALGEKDGIFANSQNIYLKDKQTGIVTNLSAGTYTFSALAGESTGRFEIIYKPETVLATNGAVKETLIVYKDGSEMVVRNAAENITKLEVFDASGRLILELDGSQKEWRFPSQRMSDGIFLLKATLKTGTVLIRKIRN